MWAQFRQKKEVGFNLQQRIIYWRQIGSLIVLFCFRLNINLEMWSEAEKAAVKLQDTKNRLTEIFRETESSTTQCDKFKLFISLRLYVKSILRIVEVQNVPL